MVASVPHQNRREQRTCHSRTINEIFLTVRWRRVTLKPAVRVVLTTRSVSLTFKTKSGCMAMSIYT